jgi:hypothetical protein
MSGLADGIDTKNISLVDSRPNLRIKPRSINQVLVRKLLLANPYSKMPEFQASLLNCFWLFALVSPTILRNKSVPAGRGLARWFSVRHPLPNMVRLLRFARSDNDFLLRSVDGFILPRENQCLSNMVILYSVLPNLQSGRAGDFWGSLHRGALELKQVTKTAGLGYCPFQP